ncbi:MAG: hypothetical protein WA634_16665 [Silvibacterium sp.]
MTVSTHRVSQSVDRGHGRVGEGLPMHAKISGAVWFAFGIAYDAVKTHGFREKPTMYDLSGL